MASGKKLIENYENREKELNATLSACELQVGHQLLSGKTEYTDDEYDKPYCLISAEISSINDKCREINSLEQRRNLLEDSLLEVKKTIQELEPNKKKAFRDLGRVLFENYSQSLSSTYGTYYTSISDEKKYLSLLENKAADIQEQIDAGSVFSKFMLKMKQSSVRNQITSRRNKIEEMMGEGAEKAFMAGAVDESNGGMAYRTCTVVIENVNLENGKLEKIQLEINELSQKLKDNDRKSGLLDEAAVKAGELDKLAMLGGKKFSRLYVSEDAEKIQTFPPEFSAKLSCIMDIREELASLKRRKEMLRCSEQLDTAASTLAAMNKELDANREEIENLKKRNQELEERLNLSIDAIDAIRQRKAYLEMKEGISVSRLLGDFVPAAVAEAEAAEKAAEKARKESVIIVPAPENVATEAQVVADAEVEVSQNPEPVSAETAEAEKTPKKRGRKPKAEKKAEEPSSADSVPAEAKKNKTSKKKEAAPAEKEQTPKKKSSSKKKKEATPADKDEAPKKKSRKMKAVEPAAEEKASADPVVEAPAEEQPAAEPVQAENVASETSVPAAEPSQETVPEQASEVSETL